MRERVDRWWFRTYFLGGLSVTGSTVHQLARRVVLVEYGHNLTAVLAAMAGEGVSLRAMAGHVATRYGIEVTHQTISAWLRYPDS